MNKFHLLTTLLVTALAPIVWGSTYIVTTELLPVNSPLVAAMLRALPAGIALVVITKTRPSGLWWAKLAILGFLNIGFFFYCLFFAATYLPGGMAALVGSVQPILVMILSYFLLNSTLSIQQGVAGLLGILGIALLVLNNQSALSLNGIVMGLIGTISMATGVVMTKRWGRPEGMTLLAFTGWQMLFGGLMLLPVALWVEGFPAHLTLKNYLGYSYLAVFGAIIAYSLWFRGIEKLPTITVSFLGFLSSVSAVVLGYIVLDQRLSWLQLCGVIAILYSIFLATPGSDKQSKQTLINAK